MTDALIQYGLAGIVIAGLARWILIMRKDHKRERDEWRQAIDKQFDKLDSRERETNQIIRENSNILTGLKTLLENRQK